MKMSIKTLSLLMAGSLALGIGGCEDKNDPDPNTQLTLIAKSNFPSSSATNSGGRISSGVVLESFVVNIREIELEFDDPETESETEVEDDSMEHVYEDVKLKGPFVVDLLSQEGIEAVQQLTSTSVPNAVYEEIEFKLHRNDVSGDTMQGKSVYAKGTINGTPFVFWHNTDEEFEIDFEDAADNLSCNGQAVNVIINFNLALLFDSVNGIDISAAQDGNENSIIEIDPLNTDGNENLAQAIKNALEDVTDLIDDKD